LLYLTRLLSAQWIHGAATFAQAQAAGLPDPNGHLLEEYWRILEEVSEHIAVLTPLMLKTTAGSDWERGLALKLCILVSLTAAAELHRLLAHQHAESRLRCLDAVFEIVSITKTLKDDDYIFLDPILGVRGTPLSPHFMQDLSPLLLL